jgi:hypothetical protein
VYHLILLEEHCKHHGLERIGEDSKRDRPLIEVASYDKLVPELLIIGGEAFPNRLEVANQRGDCVVVGRDGSAHAEIVCPTILASLAESDS